MVSPSNGDMKTKFLLVIAALAVVTVSVAAYYRTNAGAKTPQYVTASVTRGEIVDAVEATGTLQAVTTVQVGSQLSGTVKALYADFNSSVRKGQIVAELDPSLFQTQVDQARASLVKLQADVERARVDVDDTQVKLRRATTMWDQQLIARADLDAAQAAANQSQAALKSAQAQVQQATASLNQADVNLAHTVIRAPIDGIVISRSVDVGQTVAASMSAPTLFVIANDLRHMQVNASIDESDIGKIKTGQRVTFKVDAYPDDAFGGTVSQVRLEPKTESNVVSYMTIIDVQTRDLKLKPGMTANVGIEIARADDVQRVPNAALRFRAGGAKAQDARRARVWVVEGDAAPHAVAVKTGLTNGTMTALVDNPLPDGASVVTGQVAESATASASGSPLLPFGGRRPGGAGGNGARQGGAAASRGQGAGR